MLYVVHLLYAMQEILYIICLAREDEMQIHSSHWPNNSSFAPLLYCLLVFQPHLFLVNALPNYIQESLQIPQSIKVAKG